MSSSSQFSEHSPKTDELEEIKIDTSALVPASWESPYNVECPCCLEIPKQGRVILECRHLLCISCFVKHLRNSKECPVCRKMMHDIPTTTSRNQRISQIGQALINNEINRRLQHHIDDINTIRRNLPHNQLRNAPPLRAAREAPARAAPARATPARATPARAARAVYDEDDIDLQENEMIPMTSRQYIIITTFTIIDILIMLLWLHSINASHHK